MPCCVRRVLWLSASGGRPSHIERRGFDIRREVPCGQCIDCRVAAQMDWTTRALIESRAHESSSFLTLTYSDEHLPSGGSLRLRDWQLFAKRMRKAGHAFRYYGIGEYGPETLRPHYHVLAFGYWPIDARPVSSSWFDSAELAKLWGLGNVSVGQVTAESIGYVMSHNVDKLNGERRMASLRRICPTTGRVRFVEPSRSFMSRRPGIGAPRVGSATALDLLNPAYHGYVVAGGGQRRFSKYVADKLAALNPTLAAEREAAAHAFSSLPHQVWNSSPERLRVRSQVAAARRAARNSGRTL